MSKSRTSKPSPKKVINVSRNSSEAGSSNQSEMKTSEIRDLIDFIAKSGLNEVNIETKELKLHVKREPDQKVFKSTPVVAPIAAAAPIASQSASAQPSAPRVEKSSSESS